MNVNRGCNQGVKMDPWRHALPLVLMKLWEVHWDIFTEGLRWRSLNTWRWRNLGNIIWKWEALLFRRFLYYLIRSGIHNHACNLCHGIARMDIKVACQYLKLFISLSSHHPTTFSLSPSWSYMHCPFSSRISLGKYSLSKKTKQKGKSLNTSNILDDTRWGKCSVQLVSQIRATNSWTEFWPPFCTLDRYYNIM